MINRFRRLLACLALCALVVPAVPAHADGDPASDFLLIAPLFYPYNRPSQPQIDRLKATIQAAKQRGYIVRVAVIGSRNDLGAVPDLFGRPATYARFLGSELVGRYRGRLLVVMPQGYGFSIGGKPNTAGAQALAAFLPPPANASSDDLMTAAAGAVRRLAAKAGVQVPAIPLKSATIAPSTGGGSMSTTRLVVLLGVGILALTTIVLVILLWPGGDEDEPDTE
jgi:hypothetical protein